MSVGIDWGAFVQVFLAALIGACAVVTFYAFGLRLLVRSGHAPVVSPAEFTDAITVISEKESSSGRRSRPPRRRRRVLSPRRSDASRCTAPTGASRCVRWPWWPAS